MELFERRHAATEDALRVVGAAIPLDWRRGSVERAELPRFLFAPDDIIVVVGQDGLVANAAKYLHGQPVIGIDPEPGRNPGVLVPHRPAATAALLRLAAGRVLAGHAEQRTMVEAVTDDGRRLRALNELYVGHSSHQTARYTLTGPDGRTERQASSGLLVATGTGATGWLRSAWQERRSGLRLPGPTERRLAWFVREAWPSPQTGAALTEGALTEGALDTGPAAALAVTVESDRLVAFGDGIEADALELTWGQSVRFGIAAQQLCLVAGS